MRVRSWLDASPPLRPAARASSEENSCADPFSCAALPPLLPACRASSEENSCAEPFRCAAWPPLLAIPAVLLHPWNRSLACRLPAFLASFERDVARDVCTKEHQARDSLATIDGINLADTAGWLSSRATQRHKNRAPSRGPVLQEDDAGTSASV